MQLGLLQQSTMSLAEAEVVEREIAKSAALALISLLTHGTVNGAM
jgi:hypothetical protein